MADETLSTHEQKAFDYFADYVNGKPLQDFLEDELAALYQALSGIPRDEAIQFAQELAASKVTEISNQARQDLAKEIVEGLKNGAIPDHLADTINESIGLDRQRKQQLEKFKAGLPKDLSPEAYKKAVTKEYERLLAQRAGVIAENEIRQAISAGNAAHAKANGATHKVSISAGDKRVSAICLQCESLGVVKMDDIFPSGQFASPHHVSCRCTTSYFTNPDKSYIAELNADNAKHIEQIKKAQEQ